MSLTLSQWLAILGLLTWKIHTIASLFIKINQNIRNCSKKILSIYCPSKQIFIRCKSLYKSFDSSIYYLRSKGYWSVKYIDDSQLMRETFEIFFKNFRASVTLRIHSSRRNVSPGLNTTNNIPKVCDRLCQNEKNSGWGKETISLHALPEYPFKLLNNNQRTSINYWNDSVLIQSCSIWPNVLQGIGKLPLSWKLLFAAWKLSVKMKPDYMCC